jgi:tRNA(Ile)-lysidine synthase
MKQKVQRAWQSFRVARGSTVIAGVSGGPDSVALLHCLSGLCGWAGISLVAAHFNHGARKAAARDERFVRELARTLGIPFVCGRRSAAGGRKAGVSEQEWREERMRFFVRIARARKAAGVALAHTLDDQAETVLMRIIRGTGLYGLSAIAPKRQLHGVWFFRPMLKVTKQEVRGYLRARRLACCVDESNAEERFLRNRLRLHLIPLLERRYNPAVKEALSGLAQTAADDIDYLERASCRGRGTGGRLDTLSLRRMHPSLRRLRLRRAIALAQGSTRRITLQHLYELEDLALSRPDGSLVHLPQGLVARLSKGRITFRTVA